MVTGACVVGPQVLLLFVCLIVVLGCANSTKQMVFVSSFGRRNESSGGNGHNTAQTPATLLLIITGGQMCMLVALEKECGADVCLMLIIVPSFVVGVCI